MQKLWRIFLIFMLVIFVQACNSDAPVSTVGDPATPFHPLAKENDDDDDDEITSKVDVVTFLAAGDYGGGVLVPGTLYPPVKAGTSVLKREDDELSYKIKTSGLPPGAYTNWWVIFNNPENCIDGCDVPDLFNPAVNASVFWATGGIVGADGKAKFEAEIEIGELPTDHPDQIFAGLDLGLTNPMGAEVHIIIKYHGPVAEDEHDRWLQTHTLTGLCDTGANAFNLGPPFGVQCFDPQVAVHKPGN